MKQIADQYTKQNFPSIYFKLILGTINYFGIFIDKICCVSAYPKLAKFLPMCLFRAISYFAFYRASFLIFDNTQLQIVGEENPENYHFHNITYAFMFINPYSPFLELNYFYTYREYIKQIKNTFPQDTHIFRIYKLAFLINFLYMIFFVILFYFSFDLNSPNAQIDYHNTGWVWTCMIGIFESFLRSFYQVNFNHKNITLQ